MTAPPAPSGAELPHLPAHFPGEMLVRARGSQRHGIVVFAGKTISSPPPVLQGSTSDLALPQTALPGDSCRNATFHLCIPPPGPRCCAAMMLVPGDPRGCTELGRQAGRHRWVQATGAGGHGLSQPPGVSSHAPRTTGPACTCPERTHCWLAALPRLPFIFSFLQASEGKLLPLLCQLLLSHCDGSLGPTSCSPEPGCALGAAAAFCIPCSWGWTGSALIRHAPEAGNLSAPVKRQEFPFRSSVLGWLQHL